MSEQKTKDDIHELDRTILIEALEAADLSLNECAKHLLGTGPIPDPEALSLTITQVKQVLANAESKEE